MKTLAVSFVLALGLAAPAFAEPPAPAPATEATPAPAEPDASLPLDGLIDEASVLEAATPEDRAKLIRRCAGPPPRPIASKVTPSSEPVAVAEKTEAAPTGG